MATIDQYVDKFGLRQALNRDLLGCLRLFRHPARRDLYTQDAEQTYLYFLVEGRVQVNHYRSDGGLAVIAMMSPLAVIGDVEVFSFDRVITNVTTLEDSAVLAIERSFVMRYGYDDPRFLRFIIHNLTTKLHGTSLIQRSRALPALSRLAAWLVGERAVSGDAFAMLPKNHLAGILSITPRHLNRMLRQLQDDGVIRLAAGRVSVLDARKLEALSRD